MNKNLIKLYGIFLAVLMSVVINAENTKWWDSGWPCRILVVVEEKQNIERINEPVFINGRSIRRSGAGGVALNSIRLIHNNQVVPCQFLEKDKRGHYLIEGAGNDWLDSSDEIVFQVSLKPLQKKTYYIYYETTEKVEKKSYYDNTVYFKQLFLDNTFLGKKVPYDVILKNKRISLGIRGGNTSKVCGGNGKGSVTVFKVDGFDKLGIGHSWGNYLLGSSLNALPWSEPKLICKGPILGIVQVKAENIDLKWGKGKLTGSIYRYFILYGNLPYFEVKEINELTTDQGSWSITYKLPFFPGRGKRDWINEKLYIPDRQNKIITLDYKSPVYKIKTKRGWLALDNPVKYSGITIFYPPRVVKDIVASVHPLHVKFEKTMTSAWGSSNSLAETRIELNFPKKQTYSYMFGFYALDKQTPEGISSLYNALRKYPLSRSLEINPLEVINSTDKEMTK